MKIAIIALHFSEYSLRLSKALAELGNDVLLILKKENAENEVGNYFFEFNHNNLKIILIPHRKLRNPLFLLNVNHIIRNILNFSPHILHFQESFPDYGFLSFLLLKKLLKRKYPIVLTVHDHVDHSGIDSKRKKRFIYYRKMIRKYSDAIIVHGETIKEEAKKMPIFKNKKIFVIPHGPLGFLPQKKKYNFKNFEKGRLLFFGRIEKYKGLEYLIEAHKILKQKRIFHRIVIAGRGTELKKYSEILQNNPYFIIKDYYIPPDEIPYLFLNSHVVVLPYTDATQSGVLMMAMNYGRPVVATRVGAIPEVVIDGFSGLLVPPRDPVSLSYAIERLIFNLDLSLKFGENAKKLIQDIFSWNKIAYSTLNVYHHLLG